MKNELSDSKVKMWLAEPLPHDVAKSLQWIADSDDVHCVAVMPDVHLAGDVCNGTVIATKDLIYPAAIGSDIGCGMLAVAIDLPADTLSSDVAAAGLLDGLYAIVPSIKHSSSSSPESLPATLIECPLSNSGLEKRRQRDARLQLGTLGRGNHFVEFQSDAEGRLWLMLHSGSRGMGQAITDHHLRSTQASRTGLGFLEADRPPGQAYLMDVLWAIEYAMQNRLAMAAAIEFLLQKLFRCSLDWSTMIHSHHNHVQREEHAGHEYWVHRKGALSARENESGVIPGSMGTHSYHVTGRGCAAALQSSSHGAGRVLSRQEARRLLSHRAFLRQMRGVWFDQRRLDQLKDEAPGAYKDIDRVMRTQRDLTRIVRRLRPLLIYKGI